MSREGTFAKLARSRQSLLEAIEGLSEEEMSQVPLEGVWTAKDIIGHITSWEETLLAPLKEYAEGAPFVTEQVKDYLAWNDEQAALKREIPLEAILDQAASVRAGMVSAAEKLSEERWTARIPYPWGGKGSPKRALEGLAEHEMEHVRAIRAGRGGG
jgi:uncharacterized damage-inducible protein DinB